ncbi:hypothetical protein [Streptomyces subrutilus]|uniref:Uncharacterized protein n=1 Tax=Streptomyces subrutilus TaxID=36818 RepID=A0A1E5PLX8_9ACTN|nr:hypothetical protein [Streptomyces subrutilus]OEJ30535.1 hypothetical protein BGK67_03470 [Streptomyces subrutilus]
MQREEEQRNEGQGLTTERLAQLGGGGEPQPMYPGEATSDDTTLDDDRDAMRQEADTTDAEEAGVTDADDAGVTDADEATAYGDTAGATGTASATESVPPGEEQSLLPEREAEEYQKTWGEIQARFVDDPQGAVRDADGLVSEVMQTLAATFSDHKKDLEGQWQQGEEVATEDLRLALQRYRSFFSRLLRT